MDDENKEEKKEVRKIHPFIKELNKGLGKKIKLVDNNEVIHEGTLIAYSQPYLNLCIEVKGKSRFIRNIAWFEIVGGE